MFADGHTPAPNSERRLFRLSAAANDGGGDMGEVNQFGLSREIPEPVKRQVRQRCAFGCVLCGCAIIDYHHFDPPFRDATEHRPEAIALLCPLHHRLIESGLDCADLGNALKHPYARQQGFARTPFDFRGGIPPITIGGALFVGSQRVIVVGDEMILGFDAPEAKGLPGLLSARFYDHSGARVAVEIARNEFRSNSRNWDVEQSGNRLTIRTGPRGIGLQFSIRGNAVLAIEHLNMVCRGYTFRVSGESHGFKIILPSGERWVTFAPGATVAACYTAIHG